MFINSLEGPEDKNQYQNLSFYKKGGMGEIYLSDDVINKTRVAIKLIPIDNTAEINLLKTETDISLKLHHENIVKTIFSNNTTINGIEYFYLVMEFHDKGSLRMKLKNLAIPLNLQDCFKMMIDLSNGLLYAHKLIIHRDLKPENILVGNDNNYKICDFGLAKFVDNKTRTHSFKGSGTYPYMAPECWTFDINNITMDIYSAGIIFYEILTNKLPFNGRTENEIKEKHLFEPFPNILINRGDIPLRIVQMINKMTNKRPGDRYSSMQEVVNILIEVEIEKKDEPKRNERLLQLATKKIEDQKKQELEAQKNLNELKTKDKLLDQSIEMLFNRFSERILELNRDLEETKILIQKGKRTLIINFHGKIIQFSFSPDSVIPDYIQERKAAARENQIRHYGFLMQEIPKSHLENDQVILIGKAKITSGFTAGQWGYNLLLRKTSIDDLYGEWSVVWFDDSTLSRRGERLLHYPLDVPDFFPEYEFGRGNVMHIRNMTMRLFTNEIIDETLEKVLE